MCVTLMFNTDTQGPATEHCLESDESNILPRNVICFKPTELLSYLCPAVTTYLVHSGILANIFRTFHSSDARMCLWRIRNSLKSSGYYICLPVEH
jgi:hypothetical protein